MRIGRINDPQPVFPSRFVHFRIVVNGTLNKRVEHSSIALPGLQISRLGSHSLPQEICIGMETYPDKRLRNERRDEFRP